MSEQAVDVGPSDEDLQQGMWRQMHKTNANLLIFLRQHLKEPSPRGWASRRGRTTTMASNCQKCRQPLLGRVEDSLAALSPSAYDFISASIAQSTSIQPAPQQQDLSRLNPQTRTLYNTVTQRTYGTGNRPGAPSLPTVRVPGPPSSSNFYHPHHAQPSPSHASHPHPASQQPPGESFIVLTDSILSPARAALPPPSTSPADAAAAGTVSAPQSSPQPPPLTDRLQQLDNLYALLAQSQSGRGIDQPLCTECMDQVLTMMMKELDELRKEKERLGGFEKEVIKKREEAAAAGGALGKDGLLREIAKLKRAEIQSIEELNQLSVSKQALLEQKLALDAEEAELAREEELFWKQHAEYVLESARLRDRNNSLQTRYEHDLRELDKLQRTNVYNDAFCIGHELGFATINKLRLGRLPGTPVEWPEINAAWGHTILLLFTIARKFNFTFETYRLVPMGSFSRVEKISGDKAVYELYGSGDFNAVTRMLQNRRFDLAMVAFLDCLRQIMEFVKSKDPSFKITHVVHKDKIGDVSIKYQFGTDEAWTRALRHVLFDLKILLARASL